MLSSSNNNYPHPSTLSTGNILLCRTNNSIEAGIIRLVLRSRYNHAVIILRQSSSVYVVEAKGGSRVKPIPYEDWCNSLDREVELIPVTCMASRITKYFGTSYDYLPVLMFLIPRFIRRRIFSDTAKLVYCFELIGRIYDLNLDRYTPELLKNNLRVIN